MGNIQSIQKEAKESPPRLVTLVACTCGFSVLWLVSLYTKDASLIDTFWGLGFLGQALLYHYNKATNNGFVGRKQAVVLLTALWTLRLSTYLHLRNYGQTEDWRYRALRRTIGTGFWWKSLFYVFLLQAALNFIIGQPLYLAQEAETPQYWTWTDMLGFVLFFIGLFFETVGDYQLSNFKSNPSNKGKLLTEGLWSLTRHPNYFGNATMWWGFYLFALAGGKWQTIFSPILMTFLLLRVSGVSLLERGMIKRKPGYENYIQKTSAFFPWPPKN